jgi:hypothetical protein
MKISSFFAAAAFAVVALSQSPLALAHDKAAVKSKATSRWVTLPQKHNGSGVTVAYRFASTPEIGRPLVIDLTLAGVSDAAGATVDYQAPEGMTLMVQNGNAQLMPGSTASQRITVVPSKEGLSYVVVTTLQSGRSAVSTIPVQVGKDAKLQKAGVVTTSGGEKLIELPGQIR